MVKWESCSVLRDFRVMGFMFTLKTLVALLCLLCIFSCSKNTTQETFCPNYEKGTVLAESKDSVQVENLFSLSNLYDLQLDQISGFKYTSPYPPDSLSALQSHLNAKPYINARGFTAYVFVDANTGVLSTTPVLFDMNISNQKDWLQTVKELNLIASKKNITWIVLKVPDGWEKYWVQQLSANSLMDWVSLDCLEQIILLSH